MSPKSKLQLIHETVGELALEFEHQFPSGLDRAARVCPWLKSVEPDLFFSLIPYHRDARTVIAREQGFRDWPELANHYSDQDDRLFTSLDENQKRALGYGDRFRFPKDSDVDGLVASCCLWIALTRGFCLVDELWEAAGPRLATQVPSFLLRLLQSDAPLESIVTCLKKGKTPDWEACGSLAYRLGRHDALEQMKQAGALPIPSDLDKLLEACSRLNQTELEARLATLPQGWESQPSAVWETAVYWAALGKVSQLKLAFSAGLVYPSTTPYWCSPLHHATWKADPDAIQVCLSMGCPVHEQDRKYISTPFGWLIRAQSLCPNGHSPFPQSDPLRAGQLLLEHGAVIMPSHLFCPNTTLVDSFIEC